MKKLPIYLLALSIAFPSSVVFAEHGDKLQREWAQYSESLSEMGSWRLAYERGAKTLKVFFTCGATGVAGAVSVAVESVPFAAFVVKMIGPAVNSTPHVSPAPSNLMDYDHVFEVAVSSAVLGGALVGTTMATVNAAESVLNSSETNRERAQDLLKKDTIASYAGSVQIIDKLAEVTGCQKALGELSLAWRAEAAKAKVQSENEVGQTARSSSSSLFEKKIITTASMEYIPGPAANKAVSADTGGNGCEDFCGDEKESYDGY